MCVIFIFRDTQLHDVCNIVLDIELRDDFEDGSIYEFRGAFVYVPAGTTDRVGVDIATDEEAVRAATGPNRETPPGVAVFEDGNGARDGETYAQLWAAIVEAVALEEPLEWRPTPHEECWRVGIPAVIAAEGTAAMAAFLATHGFANDEIGDALGVGSRTVSQYISDFRKGER
jgi:hypothetical protein